MAATGATVYCTARDLTRAKEALGGLLDNPKVHLLAADLTSLASVKSFADEVRKRESKVNILINNAGVMLIPTALRRRMGLKCTSSTNHFATSTCSSSSRICLLAGATPEFQSRVVNVSSSGHRWAPAPARRHQPGAEL